MDDEYPRPDFARKNIKWESLNGPWCFAFDDHDEGLTQSWYTSGIPEEHELEIKVPFVYQTPASGIHDLKPHEILWYEREIKDLRHPGMKSRGDRLLLRFGAVDYECRVWVNGEAVGKHRGGHVPFDIDITEALQDPKNGPNILSVRVFDSAYDQSQPRGKQYWKPEPESIWYTPSSGIWQNVWMEVVPRLRIADSNGGTVIRTDDIGSGKLRASIAVIGREASKGGGQSRREQCAVEISARYQQAVINWTTQVELDESSDTVELELDMKIADKVLAQRFDEIKGKSKEEVELWWDLKLDLETLYDKLEELERKSPGGPKAVEDIIPGWQDGLALWSPEHPNLYEITIRLHSLDEEHGGKVDELVLQVGMRSLDWTYGDGHFKLNGKPYFHALVLDQGYWPETGITPPDRTALKDDIVLAKNMGFNGCRKHQKVEDPLFLHYADKLGYIVWGEAANAYEFNSDYVERFNEEWEAAVRRDINHASVFAWTPVNESWGYPDLQGSQSQRDHIHSLYNLTKTIDPTRPVNDNCGWEHIHTDLTTFHDYTPSPTLTQTCSILSTILSPKSSRPLFIHAAHTPGAPILCTEFGGINIAPSKSTPGNEKEWGYTTAEDGADLLARVEGMVMGIVEGGYCCGFVYTQLTDIEQEVNGLYTFDRRPKLSAGGVRAIMEKAKKCFYEREGGMRVE